MIRVREKIKIIKLRLKCGAEPVLKAFYIRFLRPIIRARLPDNFRRALLADLNQDNGLIWGRSLTNKLSTSANAPFSDTPKLLLAYLKTGFADEPHEFCRLEATETFTGSTLRETLNHELSPCGSLARQGFELNYGIEVAFNPEFKAEVIAISRRVVESPFIQRHITNTARNVLFAGRFIPVLPLQLASSSLSKITILNAEVFPYRHSQIEVVKSDTQRIEFTDESFDATVYCFSLNEHLYTDSILQSVSKVTKRGGNVIVTCSFSFGTTVSADQKADVEVLLHKLKSLFDPSEISLSSYDPIRMEWHYRTDCFDTSHGLTGKEDCVLLFAGQRQ